MASIFFTGRLPGSFIFQIAGFLDIARREGYSIFCSGSSSRGWPGAGEHQLLFSMPEFIGGEQDVQEPTSSKAGSMPSCESGCFLNVIKLLTGILGAKSARPTIAADQ
jgi:hypothetical protein